MKVGDLLQTAARLMETTRMSELDMVNKMCIFTHDMRDVSQNLPSFGSKEESTFNPMFLPSIHVDENLLE